MVVSAIPPEAEHVEQTKRVIKHTFRRSSKIVAARASICDEDDVEAASTIEKIVEPLTKFLNGDLVDIYGSILQL